MRNENSRNRGADFFKLADHTPIGLMDAKNFDSQANKVDPTIAKAYISTVLPFNFPYPRH